MAIRVENVSKRYLLGGEDVVALADVSFEITQLGKVFIVMGPSGSGKSTLLNLIGGLDSCSTGSVAINGEDLGKMDDDQLADFRSRKIGFIFQNFNLISSFSALENVMLASQVSHFDFDFDAEQRATELLEAVELGDHTRKRTNQLSGGQMQRVAIARSLMNDPDIILADEPTANLDQDTGMKIIATIKEMARRFNKLVIISTHDHAVEKCGDRKLTFRNGRLQSVEDISG